MEERILSSLMLRPGFEEKEDLLLDMIRDSIADMRNMMNYKEDEPLPDGCIPAVKKLTLVRFNQDGVEGIENESQSSGGSTSYMDALPAEVKRAVSRYRRFKR